MSAPPSQAKPPGDDFVLWPESVGPGAGRVNESMIRRSLAGLAPAELVADLEAEATAGSGEFEKALKEDRFYPASRTWFRTTAAIPPADAADKWWQESAPPEHAPASPPPPAVVSQEPSAGATTALLSPEEIWELAAEELAQASRLGAPAAAPDPPSAPTGGVEEIPSAAPQPPSLSAAEAPLLPGGESGAAPLPAVVPPLPVVPSSSALDPPLPAVPPVSAPVVVEKSLFLQVDPPPLPVVAFPSAMGTERREPVAPPPVLPTATGGLVGSPFTAPEKRTMLPAARLPMAGPPPADAVEPLTAIPVVSRSPLSLRSEKAVTALPMRHSGLPERSQDPIFAELGSPLEASAPAATVPLAEGGVAAVEEEPATGERRRRRQPGERRRTSEPSPSRVRWGRWLAGVIGLVLVAAGVAAMVGRDHLPPEWRQSVARWYGKVHQMVFPHQYGYPRRGVQPRAGQPSGGAAGPTAAPLPAASAAPTVDASLRPNAPDPTLMETTEPAGAPPASGVAHLILDPIADEEAESSPPPSAVASPSQASESPAAEGLVEPVDAFDAGPIEVPPPVAMPAEPGPEEREPASAVPPAPMPPTPAPRPAAGAAGGESDTSGEAVAAASRSFTLWEGDDALEGSGGGGQTVPGQSPTPLSEPASVEVAEGQKAVRSLVSARSVAEILPWIFDAPTLEATVRSYHEDHPLEPLVDAVIEHEYSGVIPATGGKAHIFNVLNSAHPRGFPVSAESTPKGYRIDWQSYIQWRDGWLQRFLKSQSSDPQTLFVVLRRTHYFNDDVPKLDGKLAFKVTSAVPGDEGAVAFVEKDSAIGRSLSGMYEWRTMYFPVVELQWVPSGKAGRYLRLNRIVRSTWRRIGE